MQPVVNALRPRLAGWKACFMLPADGPAQASLRLLLRCVAGPPGPGLGCIAWGQWSVGAIQFRQWKCDPAIYRELRSLGAWQQVAQKVAEHSHRCWHDSLPGLSCCLVRGRLSWPRGAGPQAGWCGRGTACEGCLPCRFMGWRSIFHGTHGGGVEAAVDVHDFAADTRGQVGAEEGAGVADFFYGHVAA